MYVSERPPAGLGKEAKKQVLDKTPHSMREACMLIHPQASFSFAIQPITKTQAINVPSAESGQPGA